MVLITPWMLRFKAWCFNLIVYDVALIPPPLGRFFGIIAHPLKRGITDKTIDSSINSYLGIQWQGNRHADRKYPLYWLQYLITLEHTNHQISHDSWVFIRFTGLYPFYALCFLSRRSPNLLPQFRGGSPIVLVFLYLL